MNSKGTIATRASDVKFLAPLEISEMFRVPIRTIHALAREGKIPPIKIDRLWRFEQKEVWKWVEGSYHRTPDMGEIHQKAKGILDSYIGL